jgi:multidrug efflux system membrane fusion protein
MRRLFVGAWLAVTSLVVGCQREVPRTEAPPPRVTVQNPQARQLGEYDDYNGWLASPHSVEVRARVRGHIMKVHFRDGDIVKEGQPLFDLDPRPFQQEIDRSLEQVKIFTTNLAIALVDEKRYQELQKTGVATQVEIDTAYAKARSLEAQVEAQKKEVERKKQELDYAHITAPITGRIGRAMLTEGNLVNAGGSDPLLATIVVVDPVEVYFSVDERALQRYQKEYPATQPNQPLRERKVPFLFGLETDDGYPTSGVLNFADNRVDPTTGTILVRGTVANPDGRFVPGSRVRVRLPIGEAQPRVVIPDTAILADQDRRYVLVLDDKNVVQRRDITMGKLLEDGMRIVTQGVKPEDRLITLGLQTARINYPVEPVAPAAPATQPAVAAAAASAR